MKRRVLVAEWYEGWWRGPTPTRVPAYGEHKNPKVPNHGFDTAEEARAALPRNKNMKIVRVRRYRVVKGTKR